MFLDLFIVKNQCMTFR